MIRPARVRPVYTYFKKGDVDPFDMDEEGFMSLKRFQKKLKDLEHFPGKYDSGNDLPRQLKLQLYKILDELD